MSFCVRRASISSVLAALAMGVIVGGSSIAMAQETEPKADQPPADNNQPATPPADPATPPADPAATPPGVPTAEETAAKYPEIKEALELYKQMKLSETLDKLKEASAKYPELAPGRLIYAEFLIKGGQLGPGRNEIELCVTEFPDDPRPFMALGALGLAENRWTDALLEYDLALEKAQNFKFVDEKTKNDFIGKCHLGRGSVFERRKDWAGARAEFEKWLATDPKNGPARQRLAQAIFFAGDVDKALAELKQAKADTPGLTPPETGLATFHAVKGEAEKAEELFKKGIEADAANAAAHQAYAQWLFQKNRTGEAKDVVVKALQGLPENRPLRLLRAMMSRHLKAYEESETELEDMLREMPSDQIVKNELALALAEQPDPSKNQRAFELAKQNVVATQQRSPEALGTLGWVYYRLGQIEQAEKVLQVALRLSAGQPRPDLIYYYAHILAEKGANNDVKKLLEQILKAEQPFAFRDDAKQWLERLSAPTPQ